MVEGTDYDFLSIDKWCEYHHRYELNQVGDYRACSECGHVFRTPGELRKAFRIMVTGDLHRWWDIFSPLFWARNIFSCPLCGHDF